jgi:hypothetical protein
MLPSKDKLKIFNLKISLVAFVVKNLVKTTSDLYIYIVSKPYNRIARNMEALQRDRKQHELKFQFFKWLLDLFASAYNN